jgi:hypothetical protein
MGSVKYKAVPTSSQTASDKGEQKFAFKFEVYPPAVPATRNATVVEASEALLD